jgi:hypothetical protein
MLSTLGIERAAAAPPKPPVNLQVLAAMAASPDMGDVPILSHVAGPAGFVELIRKLLPDASRIFSRSSHIRRCARCQQDSALYAGERLLSAARR